MKRLRLFAIGACALGCCALLPGCDDNQGPPAQQAILFQHVSFPDTIPASTAWNLRAFAYLGPDLCWSLESAGIEQQGSKLVLSGRSQFRSPGGACALALSQVWLTLAGPALPAGDYQIEAGSLRDTVYVRPAAGSFEQRLMARGQLWQYIDTWRFTSAAYVQYQVDNPAAVPRAGLARLYGSIRGIEGDLLSVRRLEYEIPGRLTQPALVPIGDVPQDSDRIYYASWCAAPGDVVQEGANLLMELLSDNIDVTRAWFPEHCTLCECVTCVAGIVLELRAPDDRVASHDFKTDVGAWRFNCGVQSMWRFEVTD